jgi:hypothetical protein
LKLLLELLLLLLYGWSRWQRPVTRRLRQKYGRRLRLVGRHLILLELLLLQLHLLLQEQELLLLLLGIELLLLLLRRRRRRWGRHQRWERPTHDDRRRSHR